MTDKRCDGCVHWTLETEDWEADGIGFGKCDGVRERWVIQDEAAATNRDDAWDGDEWISVRKKALKESRAYVQDGSQYMAELVTAPDFFCALHKPKG